MESPKKEWLKVGDTVVIIHSGANFGVRAKILKLPAPNNGSLVRSDWMGRALQPEEWGYIVEIPGVGERFYYADQIVPQPDQEKT